MTLKERREQLGMTQKEVAKAVGCRQCAISSYELGRWLPKHYRALALAELYGCTIDEIMEGCREGS